MYDLNVNLSLEEVEPRIVTPYALLKKELGRNIRGLIRSGRKELAEACDRADVMRMGELQYFDKVTYNGDNRNRVYKKGGFNLGLFVKPRNERVEGQRVTEVGERELIVEIRVPEITSVDDVNFVIDGVDVAVRIVLGGDLRPDSDWTKLDMFQRTRIDDGRKDIRSVLMSGSVVSLSRAVLRNAVKVVYFKDFMTL